MERRASNSAWLLWGISLLLLCMSAIGPVFLPGILVWSAGLLYVIYDTFLIGFVFVSSHITKPILPITNTPTLKTNNTLGVIVPVFNEQNGIVETLRHLLAQTTSINKLLVVNDGSTDDTLALLHTHFGLSVKENQQSPLVFSSLYANLCLLNKANSGKADSLNKALAHVKTDIVVTVDADTLLQPSALAEIKKAFCNNADLVAACGVLYPQQNDKTCKSPLVVLQYFEYLRAFLARAAWGQLNALLLVSGAFSAYRYSAIEKVGGYDTQSLVEDYELIHRMHEYASVNTLPWQINVVHKALAKTDVPINVFAFIHQRKRWFAGFLRTHFKFQHMVANPQYGYVGTAMLPVKTIDTIQPLFGLLALGLLVTLSATGAAQLHYALVVIAIKLLIDLSYYLWALHHYHCWTGQKLTFWKWPQAVLCCLLDPLFFQPLRHISALVGWVIAFSHQSRWKPIRHN